MSILDASATEDSFAPTVVTKLEVDQRVGEMLIAHGYCVRDNRTGLEKPDDHLLRVAVVKAMQGHVATSKTIHELATKSVTKDELYAEVFPHGPGVESIPETDLDAEVQKSLTAKIWGITNTGTSGHVQKAIAASGLVLCEAKVSRTVSKGNGGSGITSMVMGRFLTSDHATILTHYTTPAGAEFVGAGKKLDNKLNMVVSRQPELAAAVARQMAAAVKQAIAAIPHADPKVMAALVAGSLSDDPESA